IPDGDWAPDEGERFSTRLADSRRAPGDDHSGRDWLCFRHAYEPPSMMCSLPVMNDDSSDARNSTRLATSSTSPARPSGRNEKSVIPPIIAVLIGPGWTEFTRILSLPSSLAAVRVRPRTAHFDAP